MDKTFSRSFKKAFIVSGFVAVILMAVILMAVILMAVITGGAFYQLYTVNRHYVSLRDYAYAHGIDPTVRYERPTFDIRSESDPQLAASLRSKFWTIDGLSGKLSNCTLEVDGDTVVFTGNVDATYQSLHAARPSSFEHLAQNMNYRRNYYYDYDYGYDCYSGSYRETDGTFCYRYTENSFRERLFTATDAAKLEEYRRSIEGTLESLVNMPGFFKKKIQVKLSNGLNYDPFVKDDFEHLRYCLGTPWETACACLVLFLFCLAAVASLWAGSHLLVRVCCATAALCVFTYTVATSAILVPIVLILLIILNNLLGRSAKDKDGIGKALVFFCVSLIASRAMMVAVVKDIHIGAVYVHRPLVFTLSAINILAFVQLAHSLRRTADTLDIFPVRKKTDRRVFIELSPSLLPYMTTVCEKLKAYQRCTPDAEADRIYGKPSYAVVCKESLEGNEYRIMRNGECLASKNFDEAQLDGFELNLLVCRAISARMDSDKEEKEISIFETQKTIVVQLTEQVLYKS